MLKTYLDDAKVLTYFLEKRPLGEMSEYKKTVQAMIDCGYLTDRFNGRELIFKTTVAGIEYLNRINRKMESERFQDFIRKVRKWKVSERISK